MATGAPSITVVVPVYNNAAGARRTLDALAARLSESSSVELVVVDDGSTDDTSSVVADAVRHFAGSRTVRTPNRGPSAARNTGAAHASGEYLVFLDANDEPLIGWLTSFSAQLHGGIGIAHCQADLSEATFRTDYGFLLPGCFAIDRQVFQDIGGYDEGLRFAENTDLVERAHAHCASHGLGVARTSQALVAVHDASDPRRYDDRRVAAMVHLLERDADALRHDPERKERLARIGAVCAVRVGRGRQARALAWTAVRARPLNARNWVRLVMVAIPPVGRRRWKGMHLDAR